MRVRVRWPRIALYLLLASLGVFCDVWSARLGAQAPQQPAAPASGQTQGQAPILRQDVNLVNLLFSVTDKDNRVIANLERGDFQVFDDKDRQEIRFFGRQTDLPLRVGLLLDTSNSIRPRLQFEQDAASDFLFNVIRRDRDQAFLMSVDDQPEVVQSFTPDVDRLRDIIARQRAGGGTALYDAIYRACELVMLPPVLAAPTPGPELDMRRILVVISDGDDNLSHHTLAEALEVAQRAGIVIYTISSSTEGLIPDNEVTPSRSSDRKYDKEGGDVALQKFADDSGGRAFFPLRIEDLAVAFMRIGQELRSQYSLAYVYPHGTPDGKFHTVRISTNSKTLKVHVRKGYYATPQGSAAAAPAKADH
jgi:Ca-activated chloride channel homolog